MRRILSLLILSLCLAAVAVAEDMVLVKDINTNPRALRIRLRCTLNGAEYIFADDLIRGTELWAGDGLQGTTRLVKDINPGPDGSIVGGNCVEMNGNLYFLGDDGTHGYELWKSDGTAAGTVLVKDIKSGSGSSVPSYLTALGSTLLFIADDGTTGTELWKSDGSDAGTQLVKDIRSGVTGSGVSRLTKLNDTTILFSANDGNTGMELWSSDGTTAGTVLVKDIYAGSTGSNIQDLTPLGTKIFFGAITAAEGLEPWISDGTEAGTTMVKSLSPGVTNGYLSTFRPLKVLENKVVFSGRENATGVEPWVSDGTSGGTTLLGDLNSGVLSSSPNYYTGIGEKVLFSANVNGGGTEVYATDGTPGGTGLLADIAPGSLNGADFSSSHLLIDGSAVTFSGSTIGSSYSALYSTNGTSVTMLEDFFPGRPTARLSDYFEPTSAGVEFGVPSPFSSMPEPGLFLTNGTPEGTRVHPGTLSGFTESSTVVTMGAVNGKLVFAADDGAHGFELWSSDGTADGTVRISDINPGVAWSVLPGAGFGVVGNTMIFVASDAAHGAELWSTDGSTVTFLKDADPGSASGLYPSEPARKFHTVGNRVLFPASVTGEGEELWAYAPGETPEVYRIKDINPGAGSAFVDGGIQGAVISFSGTEYLVFQANNGVNGSELWITDGTNDPTHCVIAADINPGAASSSPTYFAATPDKAGAVFRACGASGCEPYRTTGVFTAILKDLEAGAGGSFPQEFVFLPGPPVKLVFTAQTAATGYELWASDLTPGGTSVLDVIPGADGLLPVQTTALNSSTVVFRGCGNGNGQDCELWKSDGTFAGTTLVKDLDTTSATASGDPDGFGILNGIAYFAASDGSSQYSRQYFRSDGSSDGTYQLTSQGTAYFSASVLPQAFTPAVSTLFFGAHSDSYGYELFMLGDDQCPSDASKSVPGLCGCGVADADSDGDGAVDCLEECPADPAKQLAGSCGCGAVETGDTNGNGAADCVDATVPDLVPAKAKIGKKKKKALVTMGAQTGVQYELSYVVLTGNAKPKKKTKFKRKIAETNIVQLKAPPSGSKLFVKYRYLVKNSSLSSKYSKIASKKFK